MTTRRPDPAPTGIGSTLTDAFDRVGGQVAGAYSAARDRAADATSGLEAGPLATLAGGVALGIVVAALLPRSERERALLAPLGSRVADAARAALAAAKTAGSAALDERGLSQDKLREQAQGLFDQALKAAGAAGSAAVSAARDAATR